MQLLITVVSSQHLRQSSWLSSSQASVFFTVDLNRSFQTIFGEQGLLGQKLSDEKSITTPLANYDELSNPTAGQPGLLVRKTYRHYNKYYSTKPHFSPHTIQILSTTSNCNRLCVHDSPSISPVQSKAHRKAYFGDATQGLRVLA